MLWQVLATSAASGAAGRKFSPRTLTVKHREPPKQPEFKTSRERLLRDRRVRKWIQRIKGDPEALPNDLSREQLAFVMREVSNRRDSSRFIGRYEQAMRETTAKLAAPIMDDPNADLALMFGLPEMQRFWAAWQPERSEYARGPRPKVSASKAAMCILAMTGNSAHLDDAVHSLRRDNRLREAFETLDRLASGRAVPSLPGLGAAPSLLDVPSYQTVHRHLAALAESCIVEARRTRIELISSLREHYPEVGQRLMIDGTGVPAWAPQRAAPGRDPKREREYRARCPEAGFRAYTRHGSTKADVRTDAGLASAVRNDIIKSWRGYYAVFITDQASGALPLTLSVFDCATDEAPALIPLLADLHKLWPNINANDIAGDSAWDEDWACRVCEVDYGIHPIFRLHGKQNLRPLGSEQSRDGSVSAITADGQLVCARHGLALEHVSLDRPSREGLLPGQSTDERKFRLRANCPAGCGRVGVKASADWSRLTYYPHHAKGREELAAYREVRLHTLSEHESCNQRLKTGRKLGTEGSDRTRLTDITVVTALFELAALSMAAATVWDVRNELGIPMSLAVPTSSGPARGARRAA